ncbi:MAG: helix-turn-helix domain-containing protein [Deltaproteobacteria bacterium]|nr:helix-turn-helix domain-containing protein [Deltaproteobacteria bacterium]
MGKENMPLDVTTIRAAAAGEAWALEKVIECYSGEIDRLCATTRKQPDGSVKTVTDEDMRQSLILKLIESLPRF